MAENQNRTWTDRYMLRLPDGMRDRIKAAAAESGRSMNAEIVRVLEQHFPEDSFNALDIVSMVRSIENTEDATQREDLVRSIQSFLTASGSNIWVVQTDDGRVVLNRQDMSHI